MMKSTKVKIAGIVSLLGMITAIIWLFSVLLSDNNSSKHFGFEEVCVLLSFLAYAATVILYILWTMFGVYRHTEIQKIEAENELLKRKIEQKKLREELEKKPSI